MRPQVQAVIATQLSAPDMLLSEILAQLVEHARAVDIPLRELLKQVLGQLAEKASGPEGPKLVA
jgi:hypothetical protein